MSKDEGVSFTRRLRGTLISRNVNLFEDEQMMRSAKGWRFTLAKQKIRAIRKYPGHTQMGCPGLNAIVSSGFVAPFYSPYRLLIIENFQRLNPPILLNHELLQGNWLLCINCADGLVRCGLREQ
jgi:hypothetical protein